MRHSPQILKLYDGERAGSVEWASKMKAKISSASASCGSARHSCFGCRRKKAKVMVVGGLLELPFSNTPRPLAGGKLKQLAKCCDLNVDVILAHAIVQASGSGGATRSSPADESCASFTGDGNISDV
ncbi:hypothetical protein ZWY2020_051097 [Hordeum vulgare]|nr:hypothetical protein ZWY2020_051097 [Hordeum vulgare]